MVLRTLKRPYLTKINVQTDNNSGGEEDIASCMLTTDCMSHKMQGCYKRQKYICTHYTARIDFLILIFVYEKCSYPWVFK